MALFTNMIHFSQQRSSASMRPGVGLGGYPQRHDQEPGWGERSLAQGVGFLKQRANVRLVRHARFVRLVNDHEESVRALDEAQFRTRLELLRRELRHNALREDLAAHAFALVREAALRAIGLRHFDVQLAGGWALLSGAIAEMQTGEGKTITATLAAATAALAGIPVHVISVNDYLVTRDATQMGPIYEMLGLSVGVITEGVEPPARRAAYACDLTYVCNKQVAFDYLHDRMIFGRNQDDRLLQLERLYVEDARSDRLVMRGLCFAIVDEADSILVDEARTPLIIARPGDAGYQEQHYRQALDLAKRLEPGEEFTINHQERRITLSERGRARLAAMSNALTGLWQASRHREQLVRQALTAQQFYLLDKHYLIKDGQVQIVDEYTGRVMPERRWEQGLHQMIEAKEGCALTAPQETLARISYQRFFRRYLRLAGMTGTAREVAGELWAVYRLNVVTIPTHRPLQRVIRPPRVFAHEGSKWRALVGRIAELHAQRCPVLVGTRSVRASEHLSALLDAAGLPHAVLNARQDEQEALVVSRAGEPGRITVATNMAGRGTDIILAPGVAARGGLHVLATELHDARRIDRQLFGRCARQGDPGTAEAYASLDDELPAMHYPRRLRWLFARLLTAERMLPGSIGAVLVSIPQRAAEIRHARSRREVLRTDQRLGDLLAFSGPSE